MKPTPQQWAKGMRSTTKRYCSKKCAAQARSNLVSRQCAGCASPIQVHPHRLSEHNYCSKSCYLKAHAIQPRTCAGCGATFLPPNPRQKHCRQACVPKHGAANPNFGKRHPNMFRHTADVRSRLSRDRTGSGNPAWKGGSRLAGSWQHQTYVSAWAAEHIGPNCEVCGKPGHSHHVVPGRYFQPRALMQFRQNVVVLCTLHHRQSVSAFGQAVRSGKPREIPFAERLPESILQALGQGDCLSEPMAGCDYSPLGNVGVQVAALRRGDDRAS